MFWCRLLVTQEEHAHLQRTIYLLSQWQRCFSVAATCSLRQQHKKRPNQHSIFDFIIRAIPQENLFFPSFFLFWFFRFYPRQCKRESLDRFSFIKFLSALIKLWRSWHPGQTEPVSRAHSWGLISSVKGSLVPRLSYYVWGAARNANTSKPPELLRRGRFCRNTHLFYSSVCISAWKKSRVQEFVM